MMTYIFHVLCDDPDVLGKIQLGMIAICGDSWGIEQRNERLRIRVSQHMGDVFTMLVAHGAVVEGVHLERHDLMFGAAQKDTPYIIPPLLPDEYHELLSEYETYMEWSYKKMDNRQRDLADRVIAKLRLADQTHECVDEQEG